MSKSNSKVTSRRVYWLIAGLAIAAHTGCGDSGLSIVPVSGKVTFSGGPCPAAGNVGFTPISVEPGLPHRPGSGQFREDGTFQVTSFKKGDGLVPGRYRVTVMCFSGLPDPRSRDPWGDVSYVPKDYQAPELVVEKGGDAIEVMYDVPLKKVSPKKGGTARM
jgi:hypothetical protein